MRDAPYISAFRPATVRHFRAALAGGRLAGQVFLDRCKPAEVDIIGPIGGTEAGHPEHSSERVFL